MNNNKFVGAKKFKSFSTSSKTCFSKSLVLRMDDGDSNWSYNNSTASSSVESLELNAYGGIYNNGWFNYPVIDDLKLLPSTISAYNDYTFQEITICRERGEVIWDIFWEREIAGTLKMYDAQFISDNTWYFLNMKYETDNPNLSEFIENVNMILPNMENEIKYHVDKIREINKKIENNPNLFADSYDEELKNRKDRIYKMICDAKLLNKAAQEYGNFEDCPTTFYPLDRNATQMKHHPYDNPAIFEIIKNRTNMPIGYGGDKLIGGELALLTFYAIVSLGFVLALYTGNDLFDPHNTKF